MHMLRHQDVAGNDEFILNARGLKYGFENLIAAASR